MPASATCHAVLCRNRVDRPAAAPLLSPISFLLRFDQLAKATLVDPPDTLAQDGPKPLPAIFFWPQPMPFRPRSACVGRWCYLLRYLFLQCGKRTQLSNLKLVPLGGLEPPTS
jgi:hypothetical protein